MDFDSDSDSNINIPETREMKAAREISKLLNDDTKSASKQLKKYRNIDLQFWLQKHFMSIRGKKSVLIERIIHTHELESEI